MSYNALEKLFGRNQSRVLKLFLHHPQTILSLADVARKAAVKNRAARVAVSDLIKLGILEKARPNGKTKKNKKK